MIRFFCARKSGSRTIFFTIFHPFQISFICSIFFRYRLIDSIHSFKILQICPTSDQHNLFDLTRVDILKTGNLFPIAYARLDYRSLIFLIVGLDDTFLLKNPHSDHLLLIASPLRHLHSHLVQKLHKVNSAVTTGHTLPHCLLLSRSDTLLHSLSSSYLQSRLHQDLTCPANSDYKR